MKRARRRRGSPSAQTRGRRSKGDDRRSREDETQAEHHEAETREPLGPRRDPDHLLRHRKGSLGRPGKEDDEHDAQVESIDDPLADDGPRGRGHRDDVGSPALRVHSPRRSHHVRSYEFADSKRHDEDGREADPRHREELPRRHVREETAKGTASGPLGTNFGRRPSTNTRRGWSTTGHDRSSPPRG